MKRSVLMMIGLLVSVCVAGAAPVLFEAYQEGTIYIPVGESGEFTVVEVSVSLDTACYVQFATGGMAARGTVCLDLDGDTLPPIATFATSSLDGRFIPITYTYLLESGEHTIALLFGATSFDTQYNPATCKNGYLQALIFLPDTATAIAEQPISDAQPTGNTPSLISQGPFVHAPGATELVDATGRVVPNAITEDKVYLSNLPQGTYFARNGDRTVVKIVKVD